MTLYDIYKEKRDEYNRPNACGTEIIQKSLALAMIEGLIKREEAVLFQILKKKDSIVNDPFHPARLQYLGQVDAKRETINHLFLEKEKIEKEI